MNTENITVVINDEDFEAEVGFNFTKGEQKIISADPNDSQEGCCDEYEINEIYILADHNGSKVPYCINFLIDQMKDGIIEQLEDIHSET